MGKRPIIGITPKFTSENNELSLARGYGDGIYKAGGLPVILPLELERDGAGQILESVDGILFSGGSDIDARHFGEENLNCGGEISPQRDSTELLLARMAIAQGKPLFGICRGMQLLNVAMGGTLHQDISVGRNPGEILKHSQEAPGWYPVHDVQIVAGSKLYNIYKTSILGVNSYHHQAVKAAGKGLSIVARSFDGIIEAVEGRGNHFILAVQWHPEVMWKENPLQLRLFEEFVAAAGG